ncbi:hypothetical protein CXG81DRAFT_16719 [Caulochytrium protostelioides]|uniref:Uncharacterized protein n=1 Tax=Caulochytrium protostelioides TaxID=1555241 RepID=A0A4P9XE27_9FUNG|nr:hypothetical protein CXG81DRAFT_16719 [Caulochytrium protostelioides]|eukprot:RKP03748.1 hypothetical protein CXG81DRAFT_16719 [Caulochytrium protostelioides]
MPGVKFSLLALAGSALMLCITGVETLDASEFASQVRFRNIFNGTAPNPSCQDPNMESYFTSYQFFVPRAKPLDVWAAIGNPENFEWTRLPIGYNQNAMREVTQVDDGDPQNLISFNISTCVKTGIATMYPDARRSCQEALQMGKTTPTDEPSTDEPSTDVLTTDELSTDEPSTDVPMADVLMTYESSTDVPTTDEPTNNESTTTATTTTTTTASTTTPEMLPTGIRSPSHGFARFYAHSALDVSVPWALGVAGVLAALFL